MNPSKNYSHLKEHYPSVVSKEQMYKICHISKETAKKLLDEGYIPCVNTGKPNRKYQIKLTDIVRYLKRRDKYGSPIPPKPRGKPANPVPHIPFTLYDSEQKIARGRTYFENAFKDYPDALTSRELAAMLGVGKTRILLLLKEGTIETLLLGKKYFIPKIFAIDFALSSSYRNRRYPSKRYRELMEGLAEALENEEPI